MIFIIQVKQMSNSILSKKKGRQVIEAIIALYPNVPPSLNFRNVFELLVAVTLSAQTTDIAVNKVTPALFEAFPNPAAFALARTEAIEPYIQTIGLFRNKAKFLQQMGQVLIEKFNGKVPNTREALMQLPGVGRKTANVVLSVGFGIPAFAVDTHVTRVCKHHRIVDVNATPVEIEKRVCDILPKKLWLPAHQAMIYFGREICHPKNPQCFLYPELNI